jgi:hypothetical protein
MILKIVQRLGQHALQLGSHFQLQRSFGSPAAAVNPMEVCQPCGLRANPVQFCPFQGQGLLG